MMWMWLWFLVALFVALPTWSMPESEIECSCLSRLLYDLITTLTWHSVTFIFARNGGVTAWCVMKSGLVQRIWEIGSTVTLHHNRSHRHAATQGYVLFYSNYTTDYLDQASNNGVLGDAEWVLVTGNETEKELVGHLGRLQVFIDSDVMVVSNTGCFTPIKSVYRVGPLQGAREEWLGMWSKEDGLSISTIPKYDRRQDFHGYPIVGTGVKVFDFFTTYLPNQGVSGYVGDIVTTLKKTHNFSLTYNILKGYAYGKIVSGTKNQWTGMVGALQSRTADLTVSELSITKERGEVISYTQPLYIISRKLFVATHVDFTKKLLAYAAPMENLLVVCVFANMAALALILYIIELVRARMMPIQEDPIGIGVATWFMVSALLQQGCSTCPTSTASRSIFWLGFFVSLIVYSSYSATLVSHLAVEKPATLPFSDLRQLSKTSDWDAGCYENDLFQVTATQTCQDSVSEECQVLSKVWQKVVMRKPDNIVNSYRHGINKVLNEKYVFIGVDVTSNYYIRDLPPEDACRVKELPGSYLKGGIAIGLQHHSPLRGIFDYSIQRMRESGLMNRLVREWLSADRSCQSSTTIHASLSDVAVIFLLLMGGAIISTIIFTGEQAVRPHIIKHSLLFFVNFLFNPYM